MIYEFRNPIPCTTELGEGYVLYVKPNGPLCNDEFAVILKDGGHVKHFLSSQVAILCNATYGIIKKEGLFQF